MTDEDAGDGVRWRQPLKGAATRRRTCTKVAVHESQFII